MRARVTVATQRPETCGLLWPSKVGVLMQLPRPLLWVGPTRSAIADLVAANPRNGIFPPGDAAGVADWLEEEFRRPDLPQDLAGPDEKKEALMRKWMDIIEPAL
jgi:colanic acid biosynthesis glycosyl transferase WcaI